MAGSLRERVPAASVRLLRVDLRARPPRERCAHTCGRARGGRVDRIERGGAREQVCLPTRRNSAGHLRRVAGAARGLPAGAAHALRVRRAAGPEGRALALVRLPAHQAQGAAPPAVPPVVCRGAARPGHRPLPAPQRRGASQPRPDSLRPHQLPPLGLRRRSGSPPRQPRNGTAGHVAIYGSDGAARRAARARLRPARAKDASVAGGGRPRCGRRLRRRVAMLRRGAGHLGGAVQRGAARPLLRGQGARAVGQRVQPPRGGAAARLESSPESSRSRSPTARPFGAFGAHLGAPPPRYRAQEIWEHASGGDLAANQGALHAIDFERREVEAAAAAAVAAEARKGKGKGSATPCAATAAPRQGKSGWRGRWKARQRRRGGHGGATARACARPIPPRSRNIVLITVESLGALYTDLYNSDAHSMPFLSGLFNAAQQADALQPSVPEAAATPCARGCNPVCPRLQPRVLHAATPCAPRCDPMCIRPGDAFLLERLYVRGGRL
jgi:hypothetical protein